MTGRTIVLVSCVKSKVAYPAKAKDIYHSTLFRAQRAYAEKLADEWFILSAKHGLLDPEQGIEPYEQTLKGASAAHKKRWSAEVFGALKKIIRPDDLIVITAGEDYCRYLLPLLRGLENEVRRPLEGVTMGHIPGRLRSLMGEAPNSLKDETSVHPARKPDVSKKCRSRTFSSDKHNESIDIFYSLLEELKQRPEGLRRLKELEKSFVPSRGIYFFFEDGETRRNRTKRVVRVGTHGLKDGSKSTLYGRLVQHRGTSSGKGNHRGSVFRLHVGKALINKGMFTCPTWAKGASANRDTVANEEALEKAVSDYIGNMEIVFLNIPDEPGPNSLRGYVERNAIGLLAYREQSSASWLGLSTQNPAIVKSFLWNVNHIDYTPEEDFLKRLESLISNQLASA